MLLLGNNFFLLEVRAFSHLLVNGNVADTLLFGSFLIWAIADLILMEKRQQRSSSPLKASWVNDVIVIAIGTTVCAILAMYLHGYLIGIPLNAHNSQYLAYGRRRVGWLL
ncbi:NnrU family protein [Thaumasiovibrio sp. DFM-14]|uniref:NnrU family protein n=1 Tax=Thaumasiovibrio sp. DFM-14 TaxID=3384792 RepID=UPI0039A197A3